MCDIANHLGLDTGTGETGCLATHHLLTVWTAVQQATCSTGTIFSTITWTLVLLVGIELCAVHSFHMFPQRAGVCVPLCAAWSFAYIWFLL